MTREEHIENLETIGCDGWTVSTEAYKSLQWAIKALEQEPKTGHWIEERTYMECPNCSDIWHYEENQTERFKFCPTCGKGLNNESKHIRNRVRNNRTN